MSTRALELKMIAAARAKNVSVVAPRLPGAEPTVLHTCVTVVEAREYVSENLAPRPDLRSQDIRIEVGGKLIERGALSR